MKIEILEFLLWNYTSFVDVELHVVYCIGTTER